MKMRGLIRALKVLSYIIWILITVIGTVVFYNMTTIRTDFDTTSSGDKVIITVSVSYKGYLFDIKINMTFTLYDQYGNVVSKNGSVMILHPDDAKASTITLRVTPDVRSGELNVYLVQLVFGYEFIGFRIKEPIETGGGP